jgi:hypothetical protein
MYIHVAIIDHDLHTWKFNTTVQSDHRNGGSRFINGRFILENNAFANPVDSQNAKKYSQQKWLDFSMMLCDTLAIHVGICCVITYKIWK